MKRIARLSFAVASLIDIATGAVAQQFADPGFDPTVNRPAFTQSHPVVLIDEAHNNFHTAGGRYRPFADLVTNDGYTVRPNTKKFTADALKGCAILVVANAQGAPLMKSPEAANDAFEPAECDAVHDWVKAGGSLLLIADHHPWGKSNERLATRLGLDMGKSTALDPANSESGLPAQLNFSRVNKLLGDHPILAGRDGSERIDRILTFAGQSLKGPPGAISLLKLSPSAVDQPRPAIPGRNGSAAGRSQGLAFALGQGRVVVLGEAGMLSAQINGRAGTPMGMNYPGTENRQFALNIMHWLSGIEFPSYSGIIAAKPRPALPAKKSSVASASPSPNEPAENADLAGMPATETAVPTRAETGRVLSSAEIAEESESSIAMITGDGSVGTGFLVRPGIIATNAHVIDGEFITNVRVRFPSAAKARQGPMTAELLYEDTRRDLAFLRVKSQLPPLRIAPSYHFRKGEDVTAIGNPGAGGALILENAISRGLMSTKTSFEGQRYYQLGIAVNPGNSGGPLFNSRGSVIGVVTRKSSEQESLAFCVPVEDLNLAIEKVINFPRDAIDREDSRHRLNLVVKELGGAGALYTSVIAMRRQKSAGGTTAELQGGLYDAAVAHLERQTFPRLRAEVVRVKDDPLVAEPVRQRVGQLADNLEKLKALYSTKNPGRAASNGFANLKATHRRLIVDICRTLKLDVPESILVILDESPANGSAKGLPKDHSARPTTPDESPAKPES